MRGMAQRGDEETARAVRKGRALKALRETKGLTQPGAAEAAGVTVQAWQNYEAGRRKWTGRLIELVCRALAITPEELAFAEVELPDEAPDYGGVSEPGSAGLVGIITEDGNLHLRRFQSIEGGKLFARDVNDNSVEAYDLGRVRSVHAVKLSGR